MNNYYFTASKWYGPLEIEMPDKSNFYRGRNAWEKHLESIPSGPSLIPEFAGMVKEFNKDFKLINVSKGLSVNITAVPVAEEGKQTFSEERWEIAYAALKRHYVNIQTSGTFCSTWIDGYSQALRDFNIGT